MATDPGKGGRNRPNARARSAALREQQRKKERRQRMLIVGGVVIAVLAVVGVMIGIAVGGKSSKKVNAIVRSPAPAGVVKQMTTIPAATYTKVGTGTVASPPSKITGDAITTDGKPTMVYIGAEYCPYCAAERWAMVAALSRFGTFTNLSQTTSDANDVYPNTPTFSFYKSTYTSSYVTFQPVETTTNQATSDGHKALETPTAAQAALITKYNSGGSIPFIDFNNKFKIVGASYDPGVLSGKSMDEISAAVLDPTTTISKSVLGVANQMTAALCESTGGKPGNVCSDPVITKIQATLNASK